MISVTIYRSKLVRLGVWEDGLALYDAIAALQPESDPRRSKRLRIARWTPLHAIWLRSLNSSFASWLEIRGLIPRADLRGADLRRVCLRGVNLDGANLYGANLRGADLDGANLYCADLQSADLDSANLQGANLDGANLRKAYLRGAKRWPSSAIPGWRTLTSGCLERAEAGAQ
jgi:hypothetical protein